MMGKALSGELPCPCDRSCFMCCLTNLNLNCALCIFSVCLSKVIKAEDVLEGIETFGWSLSGALDMDLNEYPG